MTNERLEEIKEWVESKYVCHTKLSRDTFKELLKEIDRLRDEKENQSVEAKLKIAVEALETLRLNLTPDSVMDNWAGNALNKIRGEK
jgi:hypothetical protein